MRGVSLPQHQFARFSHAYLTARDQRQRDSIQIHALQAACRSFTRVVLRLRAQAEAAARTASAGARDGTRSPPRGWGGSTTSLNHVHGRPTHQRSFSRSSSRAPSPTSAFSHSQHGHARSGSISGQSPPSLSGSTGTQVVGFQSPLFRLRRAPLLQVFVPSPEGDWLSDASVVECERELKRAGVVHLLRAGDVVWDTAAGDEGNVGRLIWDGNYLIVRPSAPFLVVALTRRRLAGSGLYVLARGRPSALPSNARVSALVLPSRHPHHGQRESHLSYRYRPVGRGDCGKSAAVAGQDEDGDVRPDLRALWYRKLTTVWTQATGRAPHGRALGPPFFVHHSRVVERQTAPYHGAEERGAWASTRRRMAYRPRLVWDCRRRGRGNERGPCGPPSALSRRVPHQSDERRGEREHQSRARREGGSEAYGVQDSQGKKVRGAGVAIPPVSGADAMCPSSRPGEIWIRTVTDKERLLPP